MYKNGPQEPGAVSQAFLEGAGSWLKKVPAPQHWEEQKIFNSLLSKMNFNYIFRKEIIFALIPRNFIPYT